MTKKREIKLAEKVQELKRAYGSYRGNLSNDRQSYIEQVSEFINDRRTVSDEVMSKPFTI